MEATENMMGHGDPMVGSEVSEAGTLIHHIVPDEVEYSDSVYSYATNRGDATRSKDSVLLRGEFPDAPSTAGDVSMSADPPVTYRPTSHRVVSSVSSVDWKTWLSANVAKAEPSPSPSKRSEFRFATPTIPATSLRRGHVRESAQIEGDDDHEEDELVATSTRYPALSTTPLGVAEPNVVKIPSYQRSIKMVTSPVAREDLTENNEPKRISDQYGPTTKLDELHTPPVLRAASTTPQTSPIYQTNRTVPDTNPGWKSEVRPQPENTTDRQSKSARRRARIRAVQHFPNSTGSPIPCSVRLRRRKQPLEEGDVASSPGLTTALERQFGRGGLRDGGNKENEASFGDKLFGTGVVQGHEGGSKKMVEMFLSSRRRRVVGSEESGMFV